MSRSQQKGNVFTLVFVTALCFGAITYAVVAVNSGNYLWFLGGADIPDPIRIVISVKGERVAFQPGDQEYEVLVPLITEGVNNLNNSDLIPLGLSEKTVEDYRTEYIVLEVHYPRPIKFNTAFRAGEPTNLLIPLTGRHSGSGIFFRGSKTEWWYGGLRMANPEPLYQQLATMGFTSAVQSSNTSGG